MNFNLNKLLPFLSLRKKLLIAFSLLSVVPLFIMGVLGVYYSIQSMRKIALENLSHDVSIYNERAQNFLTNVDLDINFLINSDVFREYLEALNENNELKIKRFYKTVVRQIFNFTNTKRIYYQIRFIDDLGTEEFRIQNIGTNYKIIPKDSLSDGLFKFYFFLTKVLGKNQLSMFPAELIGINNQTIPAISFAIRVYTSDNGFAGIFIADVFAKEIFQVLEHNTKFEFGKEIAIVNNEGYYLYHSEKKKNWNSLLAHQTEENIFKQYPKDFSKAVFSGKAGLFTDGYNEIIAYEPLFIASFIGGNSYFIFERVNERFIFGPARQFGYISLGIILIFLIVSISVGLIATNQLAKPIQKLKEGAEIISRGNYSHRLDIETNDEIELLAGQFNSMAQTLGEREKLLEMHQKELEEVVVERTKELQDEKEKLQAILDNVQSAFILIDDQSIILSASKAIESIAGIEPSQLIGKKCYEEFSDESFCSNCMKKNHILPGKISSFIETRTDENSNTKIIERMSIPLTLNNKKQAVLEILTDITKRKETEEHLLKLEKLITIGETSALLAHEIRNSLTSVKMILQLRKESSKSEEDINSLNFSLDSINRMERVVNNLLSFSRPIDFKLKHENVNQIIIESLILVRPQLDKKRINLVKSLTSENVVIEVDSGFLKEAIINLILNSVQAIKNDGEINVRSEVVTLKRNLKDLAYIENKNQFYDSSEYQINLRTGTQVLQIIVEDNGPGISKNNLSKIFNPFFTTKTNGTGLGLAMVKRTINKHGGIILVNSTPNNKTTFKLILPYRR